MIRNLIKALNSSIYDKRRSRNPRDRRKPMKICLWGAWYGSKNMGDQAILITITKLLRDRISDSKIIVLSQNAEYIEHYMDREGFEVQALNKWCQIHKTLHAVGTADLFIIGGGVPFYDKLSHALACAFFVFVGKVFGCRMMTYAVATLTLTSSLTRLIYKNILRRLDLVTVRDPRTLREFQGLGLRRNILLTADPGLTLMMADRTRVNMILMQEGIEELESRPLIGITIRSLSSSLPFRREHYRQLSDEDIIRYRQCMVKVGDFLTTLGRVVFIPMHTIDPDDDREMAKLIVSKMNFKSEISIISKQYSSTEIMGVIASCSFLLGTRIHSIIAAAASNVPFVGVAYGSKLFGITESFNMNKYTLDLIGMDSDVVISLIKEAWKERDKIKLKLDRRVTELRRLVTLNADLAAKLCFREPMNLKNI
jgi:polysaccharide pyruvyl transferase WcaK-like protein